MIPSSKVLTVNKFNKKQLENATKYHFCPCLKLKFESKIVSPSQLHLLKFEKDQICYSILKMVLDYL